MVNVLAIIMLVALAGLFLFLAARALRSGRWYVRWPGFVLSGLLGLALLLVTVVALLGFYRLNTPPNTYTALNVPVTASSENVARGEKLAQICVGCHSSTGALPLDGSKEDFLAGPDAPPVGSMYATNLTPGGPLKDWSDAEIIRAIREGVDNEGKPLVIMPSIAFHSMSDEDVAALVAYLRSQPAVERDLPERNLNVLGALFFGAGMFPTSAQEPITQPITAPNAGTPEYGGYLVGFAGCSDCHGATLSGEPGFFGMQAPNLRVESKGMTQEQFVEIFRSGTLPEGRKISTEAMPWEDYGRAFSDEELGDIYDYLHGLPETASE